MEILFIVFVILIILGISGGIPALIASSRGHNPWLYFILGVFISPILAIILACVLSPPQKNQRRARGGRARNDVRSGRGEGSRARPATRGRIESRGRGDARQIRSGQGRQPATRSQVRRREETRSVSRRRRA